MSICSMNLIYTYILPSLYECFLSIEILEGLVYWYLHDAHFGFVINAGLNVSLLEINVGHMQLYKIKTYKSVMTQL